ncbi:MAG TPA: hypothetical protein VFK24_09385 [Gammaproteobacteria bacterium]|nr:hypothetical protein [Gammaproteobacteria bacterium]
MRITWLLLCALLTVFAIGGCSSEDPSKYPELSSSYEETSADVGCGSKYSDDMKEDFFNRVFKNHWMTWRGTVVLASSDDASLNLDGKGTQDLQVEFADDHAGYFLEKGEVITVRFVMKTMGGCILPFSGEYATILK